MTFTERLQAFERRLQSNMAQVHCPAHLCIGQEQIPQALHDNLTPADWVFSTHRAHGHYLAKGGSEQKLWDEIMGLKTGINGGFSGSQSFSDPSVNFHCSAIVGGLIGVATGAAYALKSKPPAIVVCCMGDAGTEAGVFWESLNWAALNSLPICYIVENNGMSVDARIEERQAMAIAPRVAAFGVDIFYTAKAAIQSARDGFPSFHEAHVKLECDHLNFKLMMPGESHGGI